MKMKMMFADCHVHMILDGVNYRTAIDHQKARPDEALIRSRLAAYRDAGFTYLRDGGDAWGVGAFAAKIAPEYGIEYRTPIFPIHRNGRYGGFIGRGYDTMKEYAALVAEAKAKGADFIKIMISGLMDFKHFGIITGDPLPPQEIAEMIHIAHEEGFRVMAHANGARTVQAAAEAGVDSVEHGAYMDGYALEEMLAHDVIWTPTLVTIGNLIGEGRYPDAVLKALYELQEQNLWFYAIMNGRIAPGSDAGAYAVPHVKGLQDELFRLKDAIGDLASECLARGTVGIKRLFRRE